MSKEGDFIGTWVQVQLSSLYFVFIQSIVIGMMAYWSFYPGSNRFSTGARKRIYIIGYVSPGVMLTCLVILRIWEKFVETVTTPNERLPAVIT